MDGHLIYKLHYVSEGKLDKLFSNDVVLNKEIAV